MSLLSGFRVAQLGPGLAAAVCGRLLADAGALVTCIGAEPVSSLHRYLDHGKATAADPGAALRSAGLIVAQGRPSELRKRQHDPETLRAHNAEAALVLISPFGQTGPQAEDPATDLTLFYASGIARLLTGQVDDLTEAPIRPAGLQSAFIGGVAAACAGMHAALLPQGGGIIDVSLQEALATLAMTELTRAGLLGKSWSRKRLTDGNGATVCILPACDGYVAISPREEHQWRSWLTVMGAPDWGADPRFARKADRVANWDALHALMSAWSVQHPKQWIAEAAQQAHVPSFPLREPDEVFGSAQLEHRRFFRPVTIDQRSLHVPGPPFGSTLAWADTLPVRLREETATSLTGGSTYNVVAGEGPPPTTFPDRMQENRGGRNSAREGMPLSGVRVLDFSWVIAGPTTTRYLAAMGAEVIKVEAPGRGDPGRNSELHTVLGQAKRAIVLDLKRPEGVALAHALAAKSDVLIENFATGVMDRLGLGANALRLENPNLVYVSASGLGRTGPEAHSVAYGTLLQCYSGFAGLNRHPDRPPRVGFAWLDPMCGLMLAFATAAALWQRREGKQTARIDFSMVEAMLWTMADPLLAAQLSGKPQPMGNASDRCAPHGAWRCAGDDAWLALAVRGDTDWRALCGLVPALRGMATLSFAQRQAKQREIDAVLSAWLAQRDASETAAQLRRIDIPAAALADSVGLVASDHLRVRGFWEEHAPGVLPGLPWRASFGRVTGPAPELGADTDAILRDVLHMPDARIEELRRSGILG